jgi:D,D-heptose 1,7-bisphosphate phosphatase
MRKAVFLDRDGTINVEKAYLYRPEDFELERGAPEGLRLLKEAGYLLIVVTNQSGIARGYYTEEDLAAFNRFFLAYMAKIGCAIDGIYYCPHHPTAGLGKYRLDCSCRKPKTGMIERAVSDFDISREDSYVVGDKRSDLETGLRARIRPVLVRTGYGRQTEEALRAEQKQMAFGVFDTLFEFSLRVKEISENS